MELLKPQGVGPYYLPTAQRASAEGLANNGVRMTAYCLFPEPPKGGLSSGTTLEPVSLQMTTQVARDLATMLLAAAAESERKSKRG